MKMSTVTFVFAVLFIAMGVFGYVVYQQPTAFIPAYVGIILLILGWMALKPEWRMHAMHGAALVGVIGVVVPIKGLTKLPQLLSGAPVDRPHAVVMQSIMAVLSLIFLAFCIKSFIAARIAQRAAGSDNAKP
jgi:hypothetical protein